MSKQLLLPRYLVPVRPRGSVLTDHGLLFDSKSGEILAVDNADSLIAAHPEAFITRLDEHVLMPGLINMHTHSAMTLMRGFADDLRLDTWLKDHIWPAEQRWVGPEYVRDGTELAIAEMIRGGTTCFNENYFFPDVIAQSVDRAGCRAVVGIPVIDVETAWASNGDEYLEKGLSLIDRYQGHGRVTLSFAPHSFYSVPDELLARVGQLAREHDLRVHMHLLEIAWEIGHARERSGTSALGLIDSLGLLDSRLIAVHMVHLDDDDLKLLAERQVNVVHCPHSNLKLASGICRLSELVQMGVNTSIGTDGAAANNSMSMFDELRTAALLAKGQSLEPTSIDAVTALDLVTMNAAKALGMEQLLGSLEPGKQADVCAVNLSGVRTQPVHDVISQLVYTAPGQQVSDVWVGGKKLLDNGDLTTLDEEQVLARAEAWARRMRIA